MFFLLTCTSKFVVLNASARMRGIFPVCKNPCAHTRRIVSRSCIFLVFVQKYATTMFFGTYFVSTKMCADCDRGFINDRA